MTATGRRIRFPGAVLRRELSPSPLVGAGRGGGESVSWLATPILTFPHQGGRNSKTAACRNRDDLSIGNESSCGTPRITMYLSDHWARRFCKPILLDLGHRRRQFRSQLRVRPERTQ